jgi:hypothetical protein
MTSSSFTWTRSTSISRRVSNRMTGCTAPASLARQQGSCTFYHGKGRSALERASMRSASGASNGLSRERVVAIFGQFVWALREFRR